MKTDLLKDAIADADAIKKLAIENAKASLNEAFDSKIKSMLAAKLNEDADELEAKYDDEDEDKKMEEAKGEEDDSSDDDDDMKDDQDESFDIDAILAEMEDGDSSDDEMEEAKSEDDEDDDQASDDETPEADEENLEEEIDLDALIAEMRGEDGDKEDADEAYDEDKDEAYGKNDDDDSMNEEEDPDADMLNKFKKFLKSQRKPKAEEPKKESIELQEIKRQAAELAKKVNETNLINAKLLYLNKVLRDHTLSEQQKLKVVAAFDKASSVKEAKIVYESLNEALKIKTTKGNKNMLKESLGFASKASGTSTKREIISEADQHVARWQKLAGIRK